VRNSGRADHWVKREVDFTGLANGSAQVAFEELEIQATPFLDLYREIAQLVIPYLGTEEGLETEPSAERIVGWTQEIFLGGGPLVTSGIRRTGLGRFPDSYWLPTCNWPASSFCRRFL